MNTPRETGPPRVARLLISWVAPAHYRDGLLGDLEEAFLVRSHKTGLGEAHRWYWGQALRSVVPTLGTRFGRREHVTWNEEWKMGGWVKHMRLAVRSLAKNPGFSILAIVTLALGIGANTAIFSVIYGSILRPLPYSDADGIVYLSDGHPNFGTTAGVDQTIPNLMDLRAGSDLLRSSAMFSYTSSNLSTDSEPERVRVLRTSSELLSVLGVAPVLGRDFRESDDVAGAEQVAVLSDGLWRRRFGADPNIVGRTTIVDAAPVLVIGITPPGFYFPEAPEMFVPLQHIGGDYHRANRNFNAVGRLVAGTSVEALRAELRGIFDGLVEEYPEANGDGWYTWADPVETWALGMGQRSLYLLGGAVILVLLIACVNVTNLLLVRAESRHRELGVRFALGAGRAGLIPHFMSEGLVLSVLGGGLGIAAAMGGTDLLVGLYGGALPSADQIDLNGTVLAFSLGVSVFVGLSVGMVPLIRAQPQRLFDSLRDGARGSSFRSSRLGKSLVLVEVALSLVIVAGAGLLMNSMWKLQDVDLGLADLDQMMTFQISLPAAKYENGDQITGFYDALARDLADMPGVEAVGFVNRLPLLGGYNTRMSVWGDPEREANFVSYRPVTEGYFEALGVPLVSGRWLDRAEFTDGAASVLINETLARQLFAGEDPIGQRIGEWVDGGMPIVGVVGDVKGGGPTRPTPPAFYFPFGAFGGESAAAAIVRTAGDPTALIPNFLQAVDRLDSELPVYQVRTMKDVAMARLGTRRFAMSLFGVFAGLALVLGAIGIYGVMSFSVTQRSREMGVRLALGASRGSVMSMVMTEGLQLVIPGVVIGVVLALGAGRLLGNLLFEVSAMDPLTYMIVASVLTLVAVAATYIPALRATRVDPMTSMRDD